jgi:hypothetical protein
LITMARARSSVALRTASRKPVICPTSKSSAGGLTAPRSAG